MQCGPLLCCRHLCHMHWENAKDVAPNRYRRAHITPEAVGVWKNWIEAEIVFSHTLPIPSLIHCSFSSSFLFCYSSFPWISSNMLPQQFLTTTHLFPVTQLISTGLFSIAMKQFCYSFCCLFPRHIKPNFIMSPLFEGSKRSQDMEII